MPYLERTHAPCLIIKSPIMMASILRLQYPSGRWRGNPFVLTRCLGCIGYTETTWVLNKNLDPFKPPSFPIPHLAQPPSWWQTFPCDTENSIPDSFNFSVYKESHIEENHMHTHTHAQEIYTQEYTHTQAMCCPLSPGTDVALSPVFLCIMPFGDTSEGVVVSPKK